MRRILAVACSTIALSAGALAVTAVAAAPAAAEDYEVCATADARSNVFDPTPGGPVHRCVDDMIANQCLGATTGFDPALVVGFKVCFPLPH